MSSGSVKPGTPSKPGQGGFPTVAHGQAVLLDKLHMRRSTPDSEALASSEDEGDVQRQETVVPPPQNQKPARRSSWLNDTSQPVPRPRKGSFASGSISPTTSHPSTPSTESNAGAWASHSTASIVLGRGHGTTGSNFTWGTGIWNRDRENTKEPPSRLAEVLPSPTSTMPPGAQHNSFFPADATINPTSPAPREPTSGSQIPIPFPLHPTPKTYRSQSYSVGQLDPDTTPAVSGPSALLSARSRAFAPGLQHRPSRPSMLSEMANDGNMLGKVNEDDDDSTGSAPGSQQSQQQSVDAAKTIEMLTRENALLRQTQYRPMRPRAASSVFASIGTGYLQESVPEESDFAVDEMDDSGEAVEYRRSMRRASEFGVAPYSASFLPENRKLEHLRKGYWQSSLGFGGLADIPASRRHSFADVSTRHGSITSVSGDASGVLLEARSRESQLADYGAAFSDGANYPGGAQATSYLPAGIPAAPAQPLVQAQYGNPYGAPYGALHAPHANRASSPHRSMYGMLQPRQNTPLYIVLFKCSRADVFYIQEGTGLQVSEGDLVIVEADRGTDLGTVSKGNLDWAAAKELKEQFAEEHYKWLMMYSQNAAAAQDGAGAGLMAASNGLQGSAVGGMGPPSQHHMQEANSGELKPKLIRRLAQSHEVHALRDKEGNEAKAKRVCMQKVKEHGLNMEILDAEFQMDWKKLTFYYFADSYINFNNLVTDLFKIYKTRIWMSAINPASFASPNIGLQAPSGIGPGAIERRQNHPQQQLQQQQQPQPQDPINRGAHPVFTQPFGPERTAFPSSYSTSGVPYTGYGIFGNATRPPNNAYGVGMIPQGMEAYAGGFPPGGEFGGRGRFPGPPPGAVGQNQGPPPLNSQGDWVGAFQGLSLNTR